VNRMRYRTWFTWVTTPFMLTLGLLGVLGLVSFVVKRQWHELIAPGIVFALNLVMRGLTRSGKQRGSAVAADPPKPPEQEDWEFVKGISLGLQIVAAPFVVLGLLSGLSERLSGERWDPETSAVTLFCALLFLGMWFWRSYAHRDLGSRVRDSGSTDANDTP
jgi:hypothetical protein